MITAKDTAEFIGQIMDVIENFLTRKGISFPETAQLMREAGCNEQEILYGDNYSALADPIENICRHWGLIEEPSILLQFIEALKKKFPDFEFEEKVVEKPQQMSCTGISVSEKRKNISFCINPEKILNSMADGSLPFNKAVNALATTIRDAINNQPNFDLNLLSDYEQMKENLIIQLIPVSGNKKILSDIPYDQIADLAVIYKFEIKDEGKIAQILIRNNSLSVYGITHETLRSDALKYAPKNHPAKFCSMSDMLSEMLNFDVNPCDDCSDPVYVGTVEDTTLGASVLAYPGFLEKVSKTVV